MLRRILKAVVRAIEAPSRAPIQQPAEPVHEPPPPRQRKPMTLEQALKHHHKPGMTYRQITAIINELGYRTQSGKEWKPANLRLVMEPLGLRGTRVLARGCTRVRRRSQPQQSARLDLQRLAESREIVARRASRRTSTHPDQMTLIGA